MKNQKNQLIIFLACLLLFVPTCKYWSKFLAKTILDADIEAFSDLKYNHLSDTESEVIGYEWRCKANDCAILPKVISGFKIRTVTRIGEKAFKFVTHLERIDIPASVTHIQGSAFSRCYGYKLNKIHVAKDNPMYISDNDLVLYSKDMSEIIAVASNINAHFDIPESVTKISACAFNNQHELKSITIPSDVNYIGEFAFSGCTGLTEITIPSNVTTIGKWAFYCCALEKIYFSSDLKKTEGLTKIEGYAFYDCQHLTDIKLPSTVKEIGSKAFCECKNLTSINIPDSVTTIGGLAFAGCLKLKNIKMSNKISIIEYGTFISCEELEYIELPNGITTIKPSAFENCKKLTEITIPSSIEYINNKAFSGCRNLSVIINKPKSEVRIAEMAFANPENVHFVNINDNDRQ
ncbi:MAG: leucine-rich repeat domain-containing protein [Bacteroidales bacterium]|nr:leucine-rich repeat domain-containing protein [Candidatus Scybalocola fimicaballi]